MTSPLLALALQGTRAILLDFDGPVCAVFAGHPSGATAELLRRRASRTHGKEVPGDIRDPLAVLRWLSRAYPELASWADETLRAEEETAVSTAAPTPGAADLLRICAARGNPVAIVSNNSTTAIRKYLVRQSLDRYVDAVFGRPVDSSLMKPDPHLVTSACEHLGSTAETCLLVGDSETDVEAAHDAGCRCIGYANKPGKLARLSNAGADAIVTDVNELTYALDQCADSFAAPRERHPYDRRSTIASPDLA